MVLALWENSEKYRKALKKGGVSFSCQRGVPRRMLTWLAADVVRFWPSDVLAIYSQVLGGSFWKVVMSQVSTRLFLLVAPHDMLTYTIEKWWPMLFAFITNFNCFLPHYNIAKFQNITSKSIVECVKHDSRLAYKIH